jgi:hypothetical protein
MGRRSRIVSRALRDAYGPLDCGLKLKGAGSPAQLEQLLLSNSAGRLCSITSLQLGRRKYDVAVDCDDWSGFIALVCRALPRLTALKLPRRPRSGTRLAYLGPLSPTLTSLDHHLASTEATDPAELRSLQRLTELRSLTLRGRSPEIGPEARLALLLKALGGLPRLEHLSWLQVRWGPQLLSDLALHAPHLTRLDLWILRPAGDAWDSSTTAAVQRGLPALRTLSVLVEARRGDERGAANIEAMVAGLARCSAIQAIHLNLGLVDAGAPVNLEGLARLPLASLRACAYDEHIEQLARALHAQSKLTALRFWCSLSQLSSPYARSCSYLPSGLVDLRIDCNWDPDALFIRAKQLPFLTSLDLSYKRSDTQPKWSPAATEHLSKLQLRQFGLRVEAPPPPDLLLVLSGLTALEELRLSVNPDSASMPVDDSDVTDEDLLLLARLREQLTRLRLDGLHGVTAPGVVAALTGLTNLQRVELCSLAGVDDDEAGGGLVVVEALLSCLPWLSRLRLICVYLPWAARDALVAAAAERGCGLEMY